MLYLLVDRNLWSTLHAIIVSAFIIFFTTPKYTYVLYWKTVFYGLPSTYVNTILPCFINVRT